MREFFKDIRARLGGRVWVLLVLMALTGLMEGLSLASLLPLLSFVGIGDAAQAGAGTRFFVDMFSLVGLPFTPMATVGFVIIVLTINYSLFLSQARLAARLQSYYGTHWQAEMFDVLLRARWRFFVQHRGGDLMNALVGEISRVSGAFYQFCLFATAALTAILYILVAALLSWQVTLSIVIAGSVLFAVTRPLVRRAYRIGDAISADNAEVQTLAGQFLGGAKLIKASATERLASARFADVVARLRVHAFSGLFDGQIVRAVFEFGGMVLLIGMLVVGVRVFAVDAGIVVVVLALFVRVFPKLSSLQQSLQALNVLVPSVATLCRLKGEALAEAEPADHRPLPSGFGNGPVALAIHNVIAAYDHAPVLDGVSLNVAAGEMVAIVGGSGAGKSTLIDCVLQLVEPRAGEIRVNGMLLPSLPLTAWRRVVGYMAQETVLFNATIRDNLRWGNPEATDEQMIPAARQAAAHDFIMAMPKGYDTVVGDRGVRLSGGERQRLGLARVLLGRPRLLILDEATNALDAETEQAVMEAIGRLRGQVTVLVIAHRLSTVRSADRIVVMEGGRIVESGTWKDLMQGQQRFRTLWELQVAQG